MKISKKKAKIKPASNPIKSNEKDVKHSLKIFGKELLEGLEPF